MSSTGSTIHEMESAQEAPPVKAKSRTLARALVRFWQRDFAEPLWRVEREARGYAASEASRGVDRKVGIVLVTVAVCLALQRYLSVPGVLNRLLQPLALVGLTNVVAQAHAFFEASTQSSLGSLIYWCLSCVITYFGMPALVIRLLLKESVWNYGIRLKGAFASCWLYALMLATVLPLVVLVSADARFQETYPFYRVAAGEPLWPNFWRWELLYALQFFALEFFFRGFMVHGLRHRFGVYSVLVMMVPYCMIHFGKPVQEVFASIVAGIVLGLMSLKTGAIWMGAVAHVTVALSMDLTSLWRKGFFP